MTTDIDKLRELAVRAIAARKECNDPLNKSGEIGRAVFDKARYMADNEFFKYLDWHGEHGQEVDGPHKIIALIDALEAANKQIAELEATGKNLKDDVRRGRRIIADLEDEQT